MKRYIKAYNNDSQGYWYHARHGLGPGTIPRDVHLLKVVEDPENSWKDYFLLDRALTTSELKEYDLKEQCPPGIKASTSIKASVQYPNKMTYRRDGKRFAIRYTDPNAFGDMQASIEELHAYDDADYVWAKIDGLNVYFYDRSGLVDRMHLWSYDEDEYADIERYVTDVLDAVCDELINMNKDIEPVMVHN